MNMSFTHYLILKSNAFTKRWASYCISSVRTLPPCHHRLRRHRGRSPIRNDTTEVADIFVRATCAFATFWHRKNLVKRPVVLIMCTTCVQKPECATVCGVCKFVMRVAFHSRKHATVAHRVPISTFMLNKLKLNGPFLRCNTPRHIIIRLLLCRRAANTKAKSMRTSKCVPNAFRLTPDKFVTCALPCAEKTQRPRNQRYHQRHYCCWRSPRFYGFVRMCLSIMHVDLCSLSEVDWNREDNILYSGEFSLTKTFR